jgi:hypothetical protein
VLTHRVVESHQVVLNQGRKWGWNVVTTRDDGTESIGRFFETKSEADVEADRLAKLPPSDGDQ